MSAATSAALVLMVTAHGGAPLAARGGQSAPSAPRTASSEGVRDPAWSPDGRTLAVSVFDRLRVITPDGRGGAPLVRWPEGTAVERDPAWSPDGTALAFAADRGEGFDLYEVDARGGPPRRVTALSGDERWPSWTHDGRLVFAYREAGQWDLRIADLDGQEAGATPVQVALTATPDDELEPAVSPDGGRVVFTSSRQNEDGDLDLWVARLPAREDDVSAFARGAARVLRARGSDRRASWAPDGGRVAFSAVREGTDGIWVAAVDPDPDADGLVVKTRPTSPPLMVSRRGGSVSWAADGRTLAVAEHPVPEPAYNGNPVRELAEPPPVFGLGGAFGLRLLPSPRLPDEGARPVALRLAGEAGRWTAAFDRVWLTLSQLYYRSGEAAAVWKGLGDDYRRRAARARDESELEDLVDEMLSVQPAIKPPVESRGGAVVVSGHPLASAAGVRALELGGNVVDAAIAVSFALGVVEPDASGVGGDGMALVHLAGMTAPVVVDYKDTVPSRATLDNTRIFRDGRLVADGPAAANVPGVVAGLDLLHRRYGSGNVAWADLVAPAVTLADEGFVLDEALPTSLAEGRGFLGKWPEAARIYLPGGRAPRPGDRFVNRDYAATLRAIARDGADTFYRGDLARRIAADLASNGGVITVEDLAQYRAIERAPVEGRFRGRRVFSSPPPVSSGAALVETLQILDRYSPRPGATPARDADYLHHAVEAWKARDPNRRIADPALWPVEIESHLTAAHADALFRKIDSRRAAAVLGDRGDRELEESSERDRLGRGTTAFAVADAAGNMIVATQTLSTWGGSFYVSSGLGFLYNNHLRSNRTTPGAYGQLLPLARSSSTSVPTMVFSGEGSDRRPWLGVAAAGNAWITASVYGVIANVVDGGLPAQAAVEAPRWLVSRNPAASNGAGARVQIEDRFPRRLVADLTARGHVFEKIGRKGEVRYGYVSAVLVDAIGHRVEGGADPRRSHAAVAWPPGPPGPPR